MKIPKNAPATMQAKAAKDISNGVMAVIIRSFLQKNEFDLVSAADNPSTIADQCRALYLGPT
jgi:hypothetical protein